MFALIVLGLTFVSRLADAAIITSPTNIVTFPPAVVTREEQAALGYPEDAYLNFTELANKYGYKAEQHAVVTGDGYKLTCFRIPGKKTSTTVGSPVLAIHGLLDSSDTYILPGPEYAIGYQLVDAGYDLWCCNVRGNRYSRGHVTLDPNTSVAYWKFGYDEMSQYDFPAFIDYILSTTGKSTLAYIGHSQGTTFSYALGAYKPSYYDKINLIISLAPCVWLNHAVNPTARLASYAIQEIEAVANTIGLQEVLANNWGLTKLVELICNVKPLTDPICKNLLFILLGFSEDEMRTELVPVAFGHVPAGVSLQDFIHLGQAFNSPTFKRYDGGVTWNQAKYGQATPPVYNVSLVTSPVAVFVGDNDWFCALEDLKTLVSQLPNVVSQTIITERSWNHVDYLWGVSAREVVGTKIIDLLNEYSSW